MTLYQLNEQFEELWAVMDDIPADDPDALEAFYTTLEGIQMERDEKIESIACFVKQLNADAAALKAEADALTERRKSKEKKSERLKEMLLSAMTDANTKRLDLPRAKLTVRQNPPSVAIRDLEALVTSGTYLKPRKITESDIDKTAIKAAIQSGEEVEGAELEARTSLLIK